MTTNHAAAGLTGELRLDQRHHFDQLDQLDHLDQVGQLDQLERLDDQIIALLARRRAMARELPAPARGRAGDPDFAETVRGITGRYRKELGGAGELVARAVMVLCDPGRRS